MLSLILIKTRNAPIPTTKPRQIEYKNRFFKLKKIRCSLNPKAQVVNKAQRQFRPEPYFPEFFKSPALIQRGLNVSLYNDWRHNFKWLFTFRLACTINNGVLTNYRETARCTLVYTLKINIFCETRNKTFLK